MNEFERCRDACFLGAKAHQNVSAALQSFERLCTLIETDDCLLLSSLFHLGVIRYAKPFVPTKTPKGSVHYPVKHLTRVSGFDSGIHDHMLLIRNTLIAHDDITQLEPRSLATGFTLRGTDLFIPMSEAVTNRCLSHPEGLDGAEKMTSHVRSAFKGIWQKLFDDLGRMRQVSIDHPDQLEEAKKYSKHLGTQEIPVGGVRIVPPDTSDSPWLAPVVPDFSEVHSGYRYETVTVKRDFSGPERIKLPDGSSIKISP